MEVRVMQKLKHPNLVGYLDAFLTSDMELYIIMEYWNGGDLWELIQDFAARKEHIPVERVISYFVQLCLGLIFSIGIEFCTAILRLVTFFSPQVGW